MAAVDLTLEIRLSFEALESALRVAYTEFGKPSFMIMGIQQHRYLRIASAYPALIRAYRHLSRSGDAAVERYAFQRIDDLQRVCSHGRH